MVADEDVFVFQTESASTISRTIDHRIKEKDGRTKHKTCECTDMSILLLRQPIMQYRLTLELKNFSISFCGISLIHNYYIDPVEHLQTTLFTLNMILSKKISLGFKTVTAHLLAAFVQFPCIIQSH